MIKLKKHIKKLIKLINFEREAEIELMVNEIKKNDNTVNTTAYSFKFYDE